MVKAVILVKSSKKLIAAKIGKIDQIFESFPVSGQFDAVVRIEVDDFTRITAFTIPSPPLSLQEFQLRKYL